MSSHPLKKQTSLIMTGLLMAGASASYLRNTESGLYRDPNCNQYSADGSCCLKCSFRYYKNEHGVCTQVSDFCKTWSRKTGCCTSCFVGYGEPVNGVCASGPVVICEEERRSMHSVDSCSVKKSPVRCNVRSPVRSPVKSPGKCQVKSPVKSPAKCPKSPVRSLVRNPSQKSKHSQKRECSQERKSVEHGKDCHSCRNKSVGKWKKAGLGERKNAWYGGKVAERSQRENKWFSKKVKCEKEESTKEHKKERSCSRKSNRSASKKTHKSLEKKSCRSLSRKSYHSKKSCHKSTDKSNRSCSRKSNKSNNSKKSNRSCSKKSTGVKKPEYKPAKLVENKNNSDGVNVKVEVQSRREGVSMRLEVNSQGKRVTKGWNSKQKVSAKKYERASKRVGSKKVVSKGKDCARY